MKHFRTSARIWDVRGGCRAGMLGLVPQRVGLRFIGGKPDWPTVAGRMTAPDTRRKKGRWFAAAPRSRIVGLSGPVCRGIRSAPVAGGILCGSGFVSAAVRDLNPLGKARGRRENRWRRNTPPGRFRIRTFSASRRFEFRRRDDFAAVQHGWLFLSDFGGCLFRRNSRLKFNRRKVPPLLTFTISAPATAFAAAFAGVLSAAFLRRPTNSPVFCAPQHGK